MPSVSVVIPCRNESEFIAQLLEAIRVQDLAPDEVIVVDNGSTDDSVAVARRFAQRHAGFPLRLLYCADEGAAAAMNAGIRSATGDVIVRLDGHSKPAPDYIRRAVDRLTEPGAAVVGGVWQIIPAGTTLRARAIALAVGSTLGSGGAAYRHCDAHAGPMHVDTVPFGCFTREVWRALQGYDEKQLVAEDADFNYRARRAGGRVILDPAIRTAYFARRRFRTLTRQYIRYGWWRMAMMRRHPRSVRMRQLIPLAFVAAFLALAAASAWSASAAAAFFALLFLYVSILAASASRIAWRARDWRLAPLVAAAFAAIHFSWALGGLLHLVSFGRYPPWRVPSRTPAAI